MPGWGGADKEAAEDDIPYFVNRAAHGQIHQFAIIVANQSHRFVKGIDGLNRPTNSFLHGIQSAGDVLFLRCLAGFDHENFHVIPPSCKSILRFLPG